MSVHGWNFHVNRAEDTKNVPSRVAKIVKEEENIFDFIVLPFTRFSMSFASTTTIISNRFLHCDYDKVVFPNTTIRGLPDGKFSDILELDTSLMCTHLNVDILYDAEAKRFCTWNTIIRVAIRKDISRFEKHVSYVIIKDFCLDFLLK